MQQTIHPVKAPLHAQVTIPGSKSLTNRALLLAALANGVSEISGIQLSDDTRAFIDALVQLGIFVQIDEAAHSCIIAGGDGHFPKKQATVWCEEAGTVARFMLAACAATPGVYYFDGASRLRERPISQLIQVLKQQGAQFIPTDVENMPLTLVGADTLEGGEILLDGTITSQLVSALLMIAPYARAPFHFTVVDLVSKPYVDMTCAIMADFGVMVHRIHQGQFMVPVPQRYQACDYVIEPDFSTASYFFAAAAVTGGKVSIQAVKRAESKQADVAFLTVLEKMGCHVEETKEGLSVQSPAKLQGIEVNMQDFSDTFLTLAAIAPFAKTPVKITHIGHTRHKESDRIAAMVMELKKVGVKVESGEDWLQIHPSTPTGGVINTHNDHRIAMAFALIGLRVPGIVIDGAECVNKTCPNFFALWDGLRENSEAGMTR